MVHLLFAVKDIKTNTFNRPFPEANRVNAIRGLSIVVNDKQTQIAHFPQDFELFEVGTFDDETGHINTKVEFVASAYSLQQLGKEIDKNENSKVNDGTNKDVK